jgi:hypothetical protein
MKTLKLLFISSGIIAAGFFSSCKKDSPALPENYVSFDATSLGMDDTDNSKVINLQFSRAADNAGFMEIELKTSGVEYGRSFVTEPAAVAGKILVPISAGQTSASIKLVKIEGVLLYGSEYLELEIKSLPDGLDISEDKNKLKLSFSSIVSEGGKMILQGGPGEGSAINSVFASLKGNSQSQAERSSWDLAFYCGSEFRVMLNNTIASSAAKTSKTDFLQVSASDTVGVNLLVSTSNHNAINIIDDVDWDLSKTVFGDISADAGAAYVFIVQPGTAGETSAKPLKKVKVTQNGNGYSVHYSNLDGTGANTVQIDKDEQYNFIYLSFDNGIVNVEPQKTKWDIMWSGGIYKTVSNGNTLAHYFSDQVLINSIAGVEAAQIMTADVPFDNFTEANLNSVVFSSFRSEIGSSWRVVRGEVGVATDRFYLVKDSEGNVYKLRFLNFHSADGGSRGYPEMEYKLVRKI